MAQIFVDDSVSFMFSLLAFYLSELLCTIYFVPLVVAMIELNVEVTIL